MNKTTPADRSMDDLVALWNNVLNVINTVIAYVKLAWAWVLTKLTALLTFLKVDQVTFNSEDIAVLGLSVMGIVFFVWLVTRWRGRSVRKALGKENTKLKAENAKLSERIIQVQKGAVVDFAPVLEAIKAIQPGAPALSGEQLDDLHARLKDINQMAATTKNGLGEIGTLRAEISNTYKAVNALGEKLKPAKLEPQLDELLMLMVRQFDLEMRDPVKAARDPNSLLNWMEAHWANVETWGYNGIAAFLRHPENAHLARASNSDILGALRKHRAALLASAAPNVTQINAKSA